MARGHCSWAGKARSPDISSVCCRQHSLKPSLKSRGKEVTRRQLLFLICSLEKVPGKLASSKSERMTDGTNKGFHLRRNVGEERRARNVKGELRKLEVSHV